ncbi:MULTISPECIES: hypothetical protein [unclassified Nocardiopsis]|uniref:hypothetical protein n=1 Tax=unclassified Nocardiopsis TaxID=2649073 RepID=UPI00135CC98C|nr:MULTISPECIES: hypothetical protein [unclassified Nocardiopsis]
MDDGDRNALNADKPLVRLKETLTEVDSRFGFIEECAGGIQARDTRFLNGFTLKKYEEGDANGVFIVLSVDWQTR